jgi:myo-inositol 2-dehydrogenase/D-chiro-inositol 1-dehydrogenase
MSTSTLGVGILGAGPVTQAIHLPTLSRLRDVFHVTRVMDVDPQVAASVASRVGATWTTSVAELLADEDVQIVVVCSPHQFHAEQVIAACRAGKQAILCEKPFAMSQEQAEQIAAVSEETGVPIIVGAMHTFDPGWLAAKENWGDLAEKAHTIRYSIILPPNPRFEDFATEVVNRPEGNPADRREPEIAHGMVFGGIMGLAIHDLPLVRVFCPDFSDVEVLSSVVPDPSGYFVNLRIGDRNVEVVATTTHSWIPEWYVEAISDDASVRIDFMPSYVQAGSGTATIRRAGQSQTFGPYPMNGYEGEWRFLAELAKGTVEPLDVTELIHDLTFALEIAEKASYVARITAITEKEAEVNA